MIIRTVKESEYVTAHNEYMAARVGFYAGTVSAESFIGLRKLMEAAAAEWDAEREAV